MKKIHFWLVISLILIIVLIFIYFITIKKEETLLKIELKGNQIVQINLGDKYKEDGYIATDSKDGDLTKKVKINEEVNYNKAGSYQITYEVKNSSGVKTKAMRYIKISEDKEITYSDKYDKIDNSKKTWWSGNKKDHQRPVSGAAATEEDLKKYNAYYMGPDEKVLYLTFDEGGNDTYVKEIVDVLNKNDVKATFFLCRKYILSNGDLMKKMVKAGHSVGNHTANHLNMADLANKANFVKYLREINDVEEAFYKVTGSKLDKVYREPRGDWSYRSLQIVKDLGYSSYFYSADFLDWNGDVSKEKALTELEKRSHNGAIYLIHPKNKGNYLALDDFIKDMKKKGYKFDLVKNIPK